MSFSEKYVTSAGAGTADGSSLANALSWASMVTAINGGGTGGIRYNVNGAISRSGTDTISGSGTSTSPVIIRGYNSTIGDGYLGRANSGTGALTTTNMPTVTYSGTFKLSISGSYIIVESLQFSGAVNSGVLTLGADGTARNCKATNATPNSGFTGAIGIDASATRSQAIDCDVSVTGWGACGISTGESRVVGCRVNATASGASGIRVGIRCTIDHNVVYGCNSHGIATTATGSGTSITGNTIVGNGGDGINVVTSSTLTNFIEDNLVTDNTGYGINGVSAANAIVAAYNRLDRNTAGATNLATDSLAATSYNHNTTSVTQAQEYQAAGSNDYRLVLTSPAIGNGVFGGDIGAIKYASAASSGGRFGIQTGGRL